MKRIMIVLAGLVLAATARAQMPDLTLKDINGKRIAMRQALASGPVLVSFWATWCHPCQEEMKPLQQLHQTYGDSGLTILAVSIDDAKTTGKVKSLIKGKKYTFTVLLDPEQAAMKAFGLSDVPGVFIFDTTGARLYEHTGYKPGDEIKLEQAIRTALHPAPAAADTTGAGK